MVDIFVVLHINHKTHLIMNQDERIHCLELKYHSQIALLSNYRLTKKDLEQKLKGAISIGFGAFLGLADEIMYALEFGPTKEHLLNICRKWLRKYIGTRKSTGIMAKEINWLEDGLMDSFLKDYPEYDYLEANYYAGLVFNVKERLLREALSIEKSADAAAVRNVITRRIKKSHGGRRQQYMKLLDKKDCSYCKDLVSLHDLSKFSNGKPEKNKD